MRRDWDYVTIEDYQNDTREISEQAAACIEHLRRELKDSRRMLFAIVHTLGEVRFHDKWLIPDDLEITQEYEHRTMEIVLRAVKQKAPTHNTGK